MIYTTKWKTMYITHNTFKKFFYQTYTYIILEVNEKTDLIKRNLYYSYKPDRCIIVFHYVFFKLLKFINYLKKQFSKGTFAKILTCTYINVNLKRIP